MNPVLAYVVAGGLAVILLLICGILAKRCRHLPWLAGTAASMTLFLGGTLAIVSWFAPHAFLSIVPVWTSMLALSLVHLLAARRALGPSASEHVQPNSTYPKPTPGHPEGEFSF